MWQHLSYAESPGHQSDSEEEMNSYLNAAVATEHHQQLINDAAEFRRSRVSRKIKAARRRLHHRTGSLPRRQPCTT